MSHGETTMHSPLLGIDGITSTPESIATQVPSPSHATAAYNTETTLTATWIPIPPLTRLGQQLKGCLYIFSIKASILRKNKSLSLSPYPQNQCPNSRTKRGGCKKIGAGNLTAALTPAPATWVENITQKGPLGETEGTKF